MKNYLYHKLLFSFFSLFCIFLLTFILMKTIPGNPFIDEQFTSEEALRALKAKYHLDRSNISQFLAYLKAAFSFDFGYSLAYKEQTVRSIIFKSFPISARLGLQSLFLSIFLGIFFGTTSSISTKKITSFCISTWSNLSLTFPGFILGIILQYLFSIKFAIFPIASWGSFSHSVLPSIALASLPSAYITKLIKMTLINTYEQDFILLAKIKGLNQKKIILKHSLPQTINSVLTYLSILIPNILTGTFIIETIFGIPGLGRHFILSIWQRDYPIIMGLTLFYSIILIVITFSIDMIIFFTNPELKRKSFHETTS